MPISFTDFKEPEGGGGGQPPPVFQVQLTEKKKKKLLLFFLLLLCFIATPVLQDAIQVRISLSLVFFFLRQNLEFREFRPKLQISDQDL